MAPYFIDANVPMYASGKEHEQREPCRRVLMACAFGAIHAVTDAEVLQEILYRYSCIGRTADGIAMCAELVRVVPKVLPITVATISATMELMQRYGTLQSRDAVHIAACLEAGITRIITVDRDFDQVKEITRVAP